MAGWFELAVVIFAAVIGAKCGHFFSHLKKPLWLIGYMIPAILIALILSVNTAELNASNILFALTVSGRLRFVIIGLSVAMGTMTLIGRLTNRIEKYAIFVIMLGIIAWGEVMPFALPLIFKNDIANLPTVTNADNVCVQSTTYTCGPAAAVTALRKLGLDAKEGELAVLAHTSPIVGTMPWSLYKAIRDKYAASGIDCSFRHFDSVSQMKEADVTLAVVKDAFLVDHCVAILDVTDKAVIIGDPAIGKIKMSYKDFQAVWRFYGIAIKHNPI